MGRRVKTDYKGYGRQHREHRSKKNRKPRSYYDRDKARERKLKIEEMRLQDIDDRI